jgi:hypothetical protein
MWRRAAAFGLSVALLSSLVAGAAAADSPNPTLTPGAASGAVSQDNIGSTVCRTGYASEVRSVSAATKRQVFVEYGIPKAQQHLYVIDHLIPLEVGGANVPQNLWPEPKAEAKVKDKEENALHGDVCRGDVTLTDAQHIAVGPVNAGLTTAVTAKGAAKREKAAADAAAQQAQQLQQQQIAAYIAAVNQQKLAAFLSAVAAQKAAEERRQQQQSSSAGASSGGGSSGGGGGGGAPSGGTGAIVHPGAFCAPVGARGVTTAGTPMVCGPASDGRNRWHSG